jgi:hypothetical protein
MITEDISIRSYARVSAKLKERIASGEFGIGARLPPLNANLRFLQRVASDDSGGNDRGRDRGNHFGPPGLWKLCHFKALAVGYGRRGGRRCVRTLQARRTMESEACALAAPRICFEYGSAPIHNHFPESKEALLPEPTSLAMRRSASLRSCFPTSSCASRILETQAKRKGRQSDPESY